MANINSLNTPHRYTTKSSYGRDDNRTYINLMQVLTLCIHLSNGAIHQILNSMSYKLRALKSNYPDVVKGLKSEANKTFHINFTRLPT